MLQKDFEEECVFNEMFEQHHYNTYSSAKYTNEKRTLYLALNKRGLPRKVQVKANAPLGKLSTYTQVLTQPVPADRVDQLLASRRPVSGEWPATIPHGHRHHHACPPHVGPPLTASKHGRKSGRKCQAKGGGSRKKVKDNQEANAKDGGSKEDEDCGGGGGGGGNKKGNRCGGDETSHRKADAAGRKKKSKKPTAGGGKGDKPHRQTGKWKKAESVDAPSSELAVPTAVTTIAAPSQLVDESDGGEDNDNDNDDAAAAATAPTTDDWLEFLAGLNDNYQTYNNAHVNYIIIIIIIVFKHCTAFLIIIIIILIIFTIPITIYSVQSRRVYYGPLLAD